MESKDPEISVEYADGVIESFEDIKSASMDDNILVIVKNSHKVVIPYNKAKRVTIHDDEVLNF